jgi:hypothetical protein
MDIQRLKRVRNASKILTGKYSSKETAGKPRIILKWVLKT